jgi:hypothetical protein
MGPLRAVLAVGASVAVVSAPTQLGIKRVEHPGVKGPHGRAPDEGPDVLVRVPDVGVHGRALQRQQFEVLIEQLVDRGVGLRVAARSSTWLPSRRRTFSASDQA